MARVVAKHMNILEEVLWGNPYSMYENGDDRDEVIRKFKYDFDFDKFLNVKKEDFIHLKGKN